MIPTTLPKQTHWRGDLWRDGYRKFGPITDENGNPPASPCKYCRLQFRSKNAKGKLGYELNSDPSSGQGQINIDDAATYEFTLPDQALPLTAGDWVWDFETFTTEDMSDAPITWFQGELEVIQDISRDD